MNRKLSSAVATTLTLATIFSCTDKSLTGPDGLSTDDLNADAARIATVSVSFGSASIAVGDTTTATAALRDRYGRLVTGTVNWSTSDASVATVSAAGLVTGIGGGSAIITASRGYRQGSATITVTGASTAGTTSTKPGTVTDLKVTGIDSTGVTLSFTQVDDGTGQPAKYDIRYAPSPISWGSAPSASSGTCATPIAGTAIGSPLTCSLRGLTPATKYDFQVIAFRGTLNLNAVFSALSAVVTATTSTSGATPPPPAPVATVSVSPATSTLNVGDSLRLSATLRDVNNNILTGRVVTWSSSNSSVASVNSSSGLVRALAAGSATITALSETKSGTATVTVSTPPPPPPPPSGLWRGNEPTGLTQVTSRPFDALNEGGWQISASSGSVNNFSIFSDPSAPRSPNNVGRIKFPAGFQAGGEPVVVYNSGLQRTRVRYWCFYFKLSDPWQSQSTAGSKIMHLWVNGVNRVFLHARGFGTTDPVYPWIGLQQLASSYDAASQGGEGVGGSVWLKPNQPGQTGVEIVRGQWVLMEGLVDAGTAGSANGSVKWWINGALVGSYTGVPFVAAGGSATWEDWNWGPTWGGLGGTVAQDQYQYVDELYISGK